MLSREFVFYSHLFSKKNKSLLESHQNGHFHQVASTLFGAFFNELELNGLLARGMVVSGYPRIKT